MEHCVFTVLLPLIPNRRAGLETFLRSGTAESLFGLSAVDTLHFASMSIHDDPRAGSKLILELNGDGRAGALLRALVHHCGVALEPVLQACQGAPDSSKGDDAATVGFLRSHVQWPSARHVGNTGRTVAQIHEEAALHERVGTTLDALQAAGTSFTTPSEVRDRMRTAVDPNHAVTDAPPRLNRRDWVRRIAPVVMVVLTVPVALGVVAVTQGVLVGLACAAAVVVAVAVAAFAGVLLLRFKEPRDPVSTARPTEAHLRRVEEFEDLGGVQNHLASVVPVKPGPFRRWLLRLVLLVVGVAARLLATHGRLGKLSSIHFAHWSVIDGGRNLLFVSNFDGSWESYLDDFIEKAHTGLTAVWTNAVGFPRTRWLIRDGATDGEAFKAWARIHQLPSLAWYQAYPNRSVQHIDLASQLRDGLHGPLTTEEERAWTRAI